MSAQSFWTFCSINYLKLKLNDDNDDDDDDDYDDCNVYDGFRFEIVY